MGYRADIYYFVNSIEHEYKFAGNYGAKGEKRAPRKKATPEQVKYQNQVNRINRMRRLIKANFLPGDTWLCLKYPAGTRKSTKDVKKDVIKFTDGMRRDYKKRGGEEFKWIRRIEIGRRGGIHVHMILNTIYGIELLIMKNWPYLYNMTTLREDGDYRQLASYIVKPVPEECEQLSFIDMEDIEQTAAYSTSRNLVRPEPEKKEYVHRTMKKLIQNGPVAREGFYIDKNSIRIGINQYTGYSYMHYTEVRINQVHREIKPPGTCNCRDKRRRKGAT